MLKRFLCAAAGLALIAAAIPATASALSRKQANAIALRVLKPQAGKRDVILFGLPKPLRAGSRVVPADPPEGRPGRTIKREVTPLRDAAWLYWLDEAPYALFAHPSRYLLVDDASGRIVEDTWVGWYPTVNGRAPAFIAGWKAYRSKRYRVYSRLKRRTARVGAALPISFSAPFATVPPGALKGECVLIASDYTDSLFLNDYDAFSDWARSMKIPTFFATGDGPDRVIPGKKAKPPDGDSLRKTTAELIRKHGCTDIVLFLTAHGLEPGDGPPGVVTRNEIDVKGFSVEQKITAITAVDVARIVEAHPSTGFKLKVNACFSGRFIESLSDPDGAGGRKAGFKNLLIMEASSSAVQVSVGPRLDGGYRRDNPNNVSQFTNQNLTGLKEFFASDAEIGRAIAQGGSLMAHALDRAFELGAEVNHASELLGKRVDAQRLTNFGPPAPTMQPIHAVFDPAKLTTTYTESATGADLKYKWSVAIPVDPKCAEGFKGGSPQPNQATWAHPDVTQGGACNHTGKQSGPRGHPGIVTVTVGNADWTCTATYEGTQGDGGSPVGDGARPPACTRR